MARLPDDPARRGRRGVPLSPGDRRRLLFWRHGRTDWNDTRRFQGQLDVPLNDLGLQQANDAARRLASLHPDLIVSSDLSRALQTAEALSALTHVEVQATERLRETHGGEWQGKFADDLKGDPQYLAWLAGEDVAAGGAESRSDVAARALPAVAHVLQQLPPAGLAVVTSHGGTIRSLLGTLMALPIEHWSTFGGLANCCWSVLEERSDAWRLIEHNAGTLPQPVLGDDR